MSQALLTWPKILADDSSNGDSRPLGVAIKPFEVIQGHRSWYGTN